MFIFLKPSPHPLDPNPLQQNSDTAEQYSGKSLTPFISDNLEEHYQSNNNFSKRGQDIHICTRLQKQPCNFYLPLILQLCLYYNTTTHIFKMQR